MNFMSPSSKPMDALERAAQTLADAIKSSPEWQEWQEATTAFENDATAAEWMRRYHELADRWRQAQAQGRGLLGQEAAELAEIQNRIQRHELFIRQQEAGRALLALFQRTNDLISSHLGLDFAANAASRGGGCCG